MLPLPVRNWAFGIWIQRRETKARPPWLKISDVVFLPKIGIGKSCKFLKNFYFYRKNLPHFLNQGIANFYHRSAVLLYYFFLFSWAEICGELPALLVSPRRSLIAEAFMRYVVEVDCEIDEQGKDVLQVGVENLEKTHPLVFTLRNQLLEIIENAPLSSDEKCRILDELTEFELSCQSICMQSTNQLDEPLEQILKSKERTAGALFGQWAKFLGIAYRVPEELINYSRHTFENVGMALQMLDDTLDAPLDYEYQTNNVFLCLAKKHKSEWLELMKYFDYLKRTRWKHLDTVWAAQHTPQTLKATRELARVYLSRFNDPLPVIVELKWVLERTWAHVIGV